MYLFVGNHQFQKRLFELNDLGHFYICRCRYNSNIDKVYHIDLLFGRIVGLIFYRRN